MSTQYRKADCQSTKNVMGDKPVDPQSGPAGVSLGFEVQKEHAYLGHFKQEKFLRQGHNESEIFEPSPVPELSTPMPAPAGGIMGGDPSQGSANRAAKFAASGGFGAAPRRAVTLGGTRLDTARRGLASRAIRSGDMAAAAERPVLAAKLAAKAAGLGGAERRALVSAARVDPNSRMMERRATRTAARAARSQLRG